MDLANLTVNNVFAILLVFSRIGTILMILPGIGDSYVGVRFRLLLALSISILISHLIPNLPPYPNSPFILTKILLIEMFIGVFIGLLIKSMLTIVHIVGSAIASSSGLGSAMLFDPSQNTQGAIVASFFSILSVTLIFSSDLHHLFIRGFSDSYEIFRAGEEIDMADFTDYFLENFREIFIMSIKMLAPQLVVSILMLMAAGVLSRLMPALQIFFLITPIQLLVTFAILMLTLSSIMTWYIDNIGVVASNFLSN